MKPINQSFKLPKINWKSAYLYITAFLIPFLMLFVLHLVYNGGFGNPIVNILSPRQIFFNGLAGTCFLFYIRHTDAVRVSVRSWQLVFSFAYGLCSYGILQEGSISALCLYAVFPIVFLSFEKMIDGLFYLPFLLSGALILIINPSTGLSVYLFLIFLVFIEAGLKGRSGLGNIFHYLGCFFLSFLLAAFRIFPYFESVYNNLYPYKGFSASCSPFVLFSRFLPGSAPSISFFGSNGIDLYFGMFFLLSFVLFFFSQRISVKKRIFYGCFTLLLIVSLWLSPVRFLCNLFVAEDGFSVPHSFILIFWCLKLAMEAIHGLKEIPRLHIIFCLLSGACLLFLCCIGSSHNFPAYMLPVTLVLFLLQAAFLLFKKQKFLLFFLILLEFGCNTFLTTNLDFLSATRSKKTAFLWAENEKASQIEAMPQEEMSDSSDNEKLYNEFISSHQNNETTELLTSLIDSVSMEEAEKKTYCGTSFPNQFQLFNGCFKKIGGNGDLFSSFPVIFDFDASEEFNIARLFGDIYYFSPKDTSSEKEFYYIPFSIRAEKPLPANLYFYNNYTSEFLQLTSEGQTDAPSGCMRLHSSEGWHINFQLSAYVLNEDLAKQIPELIDSYLERTSNNSSLYQFTYIGLAASCIGIFILLALYMNSDKDKIYRMLFAIKKAFDRWKLPSLLNAHIKRNRVYYLSFFIPIIFFIAGMVLTDCVPFGNVSFFDEDGYALTLPSALDTYYSMKDGNTYLSMNGGYGASIYARKPFVQLSFYYRFFSPEQIAPLLLFTEALCLGLCGITMVFYMTHRLHGTRSRKEDYRLLVPAIVYALNSYMLAMHNYTSWYLALCAFPLLITAMDYLIYKKKCLPYVLLLSFCITADIYLSLYICIFLVIYFLTCRFQGIKDFFIKGIRFAISSLLGAGNCYFIIANALQSSYDSAYRDSDAAFPSIGLHTSFLEQWKKHMIFSPAPSVSSDNGLLNIYCGILTLLLVLLYLSAKKVSAKEKLKKILPILFLYISFNGKVLSYLWGGLHYQSKVPNRFAFLLLFLIAELSYDGLRLIKKTSVRKYSLLAMIVAGFFLICQFLSSGNTVLAWSSTLILCAFYLIVHSLAAHFKKQQLYGKLLVFFLIAELGCNMLYIVTTYQTDAIRLYGDYPAMASIFESELEDESGYYRACFPSSLYNNPGQVYHTGSGSLFNSYVSKHQNMTNMYYGFLTTFGNNIRPNFPGTPFGLSLSSHRYILIPAMSKNMVKDLDRYEYLGTFENYYIFENPSSLSLGIYAPTEAVELDHIYLWQFYNDLADLYTDTEASLFIPHTLKYTESGSDSDDSFYLINGNKKLSFEEAKSTCAALEDDGTSNIWLCFNYKPLMKGYAYLYADEFIPLGDAEADIVSTGTIPFKKDATDLSDTYNAAIMNEDVFNEFISEAHKNQLENIRIGNDTISGTTNYEEDGYTMLSLACDRNWHAYIDGSEVEIEDPYNSFMFIKTPAGNHTLELKYIPYGMKESKLVSMGFLLLTLLLLFAENRKKKKG